MLKYRINHISNLDQIPMKIMGFSKDFVIELNEGNIKNRILEIIDHENTISNRNSPLMSKDKKWNFKTLLKSFFDLFS